MSITKELTINVLLVGEYQTGKSSWLNMLRCGEFEQVQNPILNQEITLKIHDVLVNLKIFNEKSESNIFEEESGNSVRLSERSGINLNSVDWIIVFDDIEDLHSSQEIERYIFALRRLIGRNLPVIVCRSLCDLKQTMDEEVRDIRDVEERVSEVDVFNVSSFTDYNVIHPLKYISKRVILR